MGSDSACERVAREPVAAVKAHGICPIPANERAGRAASTFAFLARVVEETGSSRAELKFRSWRTWAGRRGERQGRPGGS